MIQFKSGKLRVSLAALAVICVPFPASAALIDRGGGLFYDTVLDVTWLQDANYAQTVGFTPSGFIDDWATAVAWVEGVEYYDSVRDVIWDDWRLPSDDLSCQDMCTEHELGRLYFTEGVTFFTPAPFFNLQAGFYWFGPTGQPFQEESRSFSFLGGVTALPVSGGEAGFALLVRDGDVVPVPGALLLLLSGLASLAALRNRPS